MNDQPRTAVGLFWELMDWKGPAPWRLHEVRRELARLIEEERWADALILAMVRDRSVAEEAQDPAPAHADPAPAPPSARARTTMTGWRGQEALGDKLRHTDLVP